MIIKPEEFSNFQLNPFYLLGSDENALSKAFAFVLSKSPKFLFIFLRYIGLNIKFSQSTFNKISIQIERKRIEGRTDIEIILENKFHIIIECKVKQNKIDIQRNQYIKSFNDTPNKILCFLTQTNDFKLQIEKNIQIRNIGWIEIDNLIAEKTFEDDQYFQDFKNFICFLEILKINSLIILFKLKTKINNYF